MECNGNHKKLCILSDCKKCFERSFASHEKSTFMIDNVNPRSICKGTKKVYVFLCDVCWHFFENDLSHVTREKPRWCPYCSHTMLCEYDDCTLCFEKSFASHEKSMYLTDKTINPRHIFKSSHYKYEFTCGVCNHKFTCSVYEVTCGDGHWCPFPCCSTRPKQLCSNESCVSCYNRSFASHAKSMYLTDKTINPRSIFKQCNDKFTFTCENGHEFPCSISHVSSATAPSWCPHCKKGRQYSLVSIQWLEYIGDLQHYLSSIHGEYRIPGTKYKADGYCEKTNTIYEFHGDIWHGNPKFYKPEDVCPLSNRRTTYGELYESTLKKKEAILSLGFKYIEMWQSDWVRIQKTMRLWKKLYEKTK